MATSLLLLNVSAPNVALPAIGRGLEARFTDLQWVVSGYALTLAATLLTAGTLADRFGRKRLFLVGLALFTLCSLACSVAPSAPALIVARAVQGVGGAMVFSSALSLLAEAFGPAERGRALGIWGATVAFAFAVGPLEGGLLTEAFGWRALFAVNVLLGGPAALIGLRHLVESRDPDPAGVDWPGVTALSAGLLAGVFALVRGNALGWTSPTILLLLAAAALALGVFVAVERRARHPMLDLALFRTPTFAAASLVVAAFGSTFAAILYLTLFLLEVRGASPVRAGLELLPFAAVSFVVSVLAGRWRALPLRVALSGGIALSALGFFLLHGLRPDADLARLLPGLLVAGAGAGLVNPATTFAHLGTAPAHRSGMAAGVNNTFRQLGVALGIAGLGAVVERTVRARTLEDLAGAPLTAGQRTQVADALGAGDLAGALSSVPRAVRPAVEAAYDRAFTGALDRVFVLSAAVALLGALAGLALVRARDLAGA